MSELHSSIRQSSIWMIVRLGISLTVGVLVTTFIIRSLSLEEYGIYNVLYSLIGYISVIGSFGIPEVFRRFIPEAFQKKDYSLLKQLVWRGLLLRLLLSSLIVVTIFLFHGPIGSLLKLESFFDYYIIFSFGIVIVLETTLLNSVLHSLFLHKYSVIASTLYTVFRGTCVFVLLKLGWGIYGVLVAEVIAWGVWAALQLFFYYIKFVKIYPSEKSTFFPLRRYFRYGGFSSLNQLGSSVLGVSTDFFIITAFLGPGAVALYAFADRVIRLITNCMPHVFLIDVIRPTFFTQYAESKNKQHLSDMFNLLVKIGAFCVFPLAAGIFVLGDKMISCVFKPDYLPAMYIMWILIVFTGINVFATPATLVLQAIEEVQILFYSKVFAIYNLLAAFLVIQWYGVMGVVLVTCSANAMKNMFLYYYAKKFCGLRLDWRGLKVIAFNSMVMTIACFSMRDFVDGIVTLGFSAMAGVIVFLVCSWKNQAFSAQERRWINQVAPRPLFVF